MILAGLVIAWLIGLALASHTQQSPAVWLVLAAIGFAGWFINRQRRSIWRWITIGLFAFGLGAARQAFSFQPLSASDLAYYNDRGTLRLSGVIIDVPDVRDKDIQLRVHIDSLQSGKSSLPVSGLALVLAPPLGSYSYGDRLTIYGAPLTPPTFDTFDYQAYLANGNIYTVIELPTISVTAHDQGNPLLSVIYRFKVHAQSLINSWLPSPQSALLDGILLGIRTELPADIRNDFSQTGTARILAIDGAKMAIVIGLLTAFFSPLKRRWIAVSVIVGCVLTYTLFVGAPVSAVRAAVMGILVVVAAQLGREYSGLAGLSFAIWLQTVIEPSAINEAGLWISASSTLGLVIAGAPVKKAVDGWLEKRFTRATVRLFSSVIIESILVTLIVTVAATPVVILTFGQFSWLGIIINILINPAQALILTFGLPAVILGSVIAPLGQVLAWLSALPLSYTLRVVRGAAQIPGIDYNVTISPVAVAFCYLLMFAIWRWREQPVETRRQWLLVMHRQLTTPTVAVVGGGIAVLLWTSALARPDGKLHVWFLDVGGNAVLIESPAGAFILIDGGQNPTRLMAALGDRLPFNQRTLDALFITEEKAADIAALPTLFARYQVHTVLNSGKNDNPEMSAIINTADAAGSSLLTVSAGFSLNTADGVQITILNPNQPPDSKTKVDEAALVYRLSYGDVSFILTSDLAAFTESQLIRSQYMRGSVLQLPSHGADAANPNDFLKAVAPQVAVIEIDSGNRAALPAPSTLHRLGSIPVYRTDQQGTLAFASDGRHLWLGFDR